MGLKRLIGTRKETETTVITSPIKPEEKKQIITSTEIIDRCYKEFESTLNYTYFNIESAVKLYEKLFNSEEYDLDYNTQMKLITEFTEKVFIDLCASDDDEDGEQAEIFVVALYIVSEKYKLNFREVVDRVIFKKVFVKEESMISECVFVWNFSAFDKFLELPYEYSYISLQDVIETLSDIFLDYFVKFYENSDEVSIETLSKVARCADGYVDFEEKIYEDIIQRDESFNSTIAIYVAKNFPALNYHILTWALESIKSELMTSDFTEEEGELYANELIELLQNMGDYSKYQYYEYDIKKNWREIIEAVLKSLDGITLNRIIEILCDNFYISRDEIEEYIEQLVFRIAQYLQSVNPVKKFNRLTKLISNPAVLRVVDKEDGFIISLFMK